MVLGGGFDSTLNGHSSEHEALVALSVLSWPSVRHPVQHPGKSYWLSGNPAGASVEVAAGPSRVVPNKKVPGSLPLPNGILTEFLRENQCQSWFPRSRPIPLPLSAVDDQ